MDSPRLPLAPKAPLRRRAHPSARSRWAGCAIALMAVLGHAHAGVLTIPGAGPPEPGLRALAVEFAKTHTGMAVEVPPSIGIAGGLRVIQAKEAPIVRLARRLSEEELSRFGLKQLVYGADAVVFATGRDVSISDVTEGQLLSLFSGSKTDWSELGATRGPVLVFYREPSEVAHQAIKQHLPQFAGLTFAASAKLANSDTAMRDGLAKYRTSIGWTTLSAVSAGSERLKSLSVNGVQASAAAVASGLYRMRVEHVLVYRESALTEEGRRFLGFVGSARGSRALRQLDVVPLLAASR
ncbi:MAG: substrate-binding domain-containing protein [Burkholderiaceae bacterium]|nr:substrate-binding domain-containing protein [Burkholderiaceae bacterium]